MGDSDKCPPGVTTQSLRLVSEVRPEEGGRWLASFLRVRTEEIANLVRITGRARLSDLGRDDLVNEDRDLARLTGVRWIDGRIQDRTPTWRISSTNEAAASRGEAAP